MSKLKITKNTDNTITVIAGTYKEHISLDGKGPVELVDCVRWAAIVGGVMADEALLWEQIRELIAA